MVLSKQQCGSQPCAQAFGGLLGSCETAWENVPRRLFSIFLLAGGLREVIAPRHTASWPQLQHNNSSSRGSPCQAMWMEDSWGTALPGLRALYILPTAGSSSL